MTAPIAELTAITEALARCRASNEKGWDILVGLSKWTIFTDGSAPIKNPGGAIGFSAVFVLDQELAFEVFGGTPGRTTEPATSNNRAEIAGVIAILELLYQLKLQGATLPQEVNITCDSQYVVHCAQGKWKKHKNRDLWARFDQLMCVCRQQKVKVQFGWTRAHVGTKWNERADVLAKDGAFLAIGREPGPQDHDEEPTPLLPKETVVTPVCHYRLRIYSEMNGKSQATGTYQLATPQKDRQRVVHLHNVLTLDEAEYQLLIQGLDDLLTTLGDANREPGDFRVEVDSSRELMLKQLQGLYGVKSERLQPLHQKARVAIRKFASIQWQMSKKNELKDALRNW